MDFAGALFFRRPTSRIGGTLIAAISCLYLLAGPLPASASSYPDQTIKIVVPLAPGGPTDIIARLLSTSLSKELGVSVIVENRPGGHGNIGIGGVAKAAPDGYTLLIVSNLILGKPAVSKTPYDPLADFAPAFDFGGSPNVIAAHPQVPFANLREMIAYAKAHPGELNYATSGAGSLSQLGTELLALQAGIKLVHVPYTGGNPAVQSTVAGTTHLVVANSASVISYLKEGTLRAITQTGAKRWRDLPDLPTQSESGITNADYGTYYGLFVPAGTPQAVLNLLYNKVNSIVSQPDIRQQLERVGIDPAEGGGPDHLRERMIRELPMWKDIARRAGF